MEHYDPQLAERVWQRVRGGPVPEAAPSLPDLRGPLLQERQEARIYRQLSRTLRSPTLQQLLQETQHCITALEGLSLLLQDSACEKPSLGGSVGLPSPALRRCYHSTLQRKGHYALHRDHPTAGPVFSALAESAARRCFLLARVMGEIGD